VRSESLGFDGDRAPQHHDRPYRARKRRANLRRLVKRVLRKHGYPPDKQEKATLTVLEQAEVIAREWAG
jgi:hypothetical protein